MVQGDAQLNAGDRQLEIKQLSDKVVIDYQQFSIERDEKVNFIQPSASSVALNRVLGSDLSRIDGQINANGLVYLVNPNGIVFGQGSQINVGGLMASTLPVDDASLGQGELHLQGAGGKLVNAGDIRATGDVALVGGDISNTGTVQGRNVALVAGDQVWVKQEGSAIAILAETPVGTVQNTGQLQGEQIELRAGGEAGVISLRNDGLVRATAASAEGGVIHLDGGQGDVWNQGTLDASADAGKGGTIKVKAQRIAQLGTVRANAEGVGNGGNINLRAEETLALGAQASLQANADERGKGGEIIAYTPGVALFREGSAISARGGQLGGDGGFAEVSGRQSVDIQGRVDVGAAAGAAGPPEWSWPA